MARRVYTWLQSHERVNTLLGFMTRNPAARLARRCGLNEVTCGNLWRRPGELRTLEKLLGGIKDDFDKPHYPVQLYSAKGELLEREALLVQGDEVVVDYVTAVFDGLVDQGVKTLERKAYGAHVKQREEYVDEVLAEVRARITQSRVKKKPSIPDLKKFLTFTGRTSSETVDKLALGFGLSVRYLDTLKERY